MSDTRLDQARAEAERRWPRNQSPDDPYPEGRRRRMSMDRRIGFELGVVWADANPKPHTITRAEFLEALDAHVGLGASGDWVTVEDMLIAAFMAAGIEVRDE